MTGFCKNKICFERDNFLALMEVFKRCTFTEAHCRTRNLMVGLTRSVTIVVSLLKAWPREQRALVRNRARPDRRQDHASFRGHFVFRFGVRVSFLGHFVFRFGVRVSFRGHFVFRFGVRIGLQISGLRFGSFRFVDPPTPTRVN